MTTISTEKLRNFLKSQVNLLEPAEIGYAIKMVKLINHQEQRFETMNYFKWLKDRKYATHRQIASFAIAVFKNVGAEYSFFTT